MKYNISKQFFPFSHFKPPISEGFLSLAVPFMKAPKSIFKDKRINVERHAFNSFDGCELECLMISPASLSGAAPCLVYIHGGGFVLEAAGYHYNNSVRYALEVGCRVLFVKYRLAPKHKHPIFFEDCFAAVCWLYDNADALCVDLNRIGIGGDSAGSTLAVGCQMIARDRHHPIRFRFQMLPYPFLDARNNSDSAKRYTDTPMWNSTLSNRIAPMTRVDRSRSDYIYYSPVEAECFEGLPPAYIETAEFDCLHDDGILYAKKLREAGIRVVLNETYSTMHGFDIVQNAQTTKKALCARIEFMKEQYRTKDQ